MADRCGERAVRAARGPALSPWRSGAVATAASLWQQKRGVVSGGSLGLPPAWYVFTGVKKKTFTLGEWIASGKGLAFSGSSISLGPGVSTVLTDHGSAISPADSYSPLLVVDNMD